MTPLRLRASLALVVAAFTAACGDSGTSGPAFSDSVSTADAQEFASYAAGYADYVASSINFGGPSIALTAPATAARLTASLPRTAPAFAGRSFAAPDLSMLDWRTALARTRGPQAVAAEGCTYSGHGTYGLGGGEPVDVNSNGIPDDYLVRIECVQTDSTSDPDTTITQRVVQEVAVKEIMTSLYGQTIRVIVQQRLEDNFGNFQEIKYNITGTQDIRSNGITDKAAFTVAQAEKFDTASASASAGESWNNSFDPVGDIAIGSDIPDGALLINGRRYYVDSEDVSLSFGIETTTPLAYSAACAAVPTDPPFTAGAIRGRLNNNANQASFLVTFTGCGTYTVETNGTQDPTPVVMR